MDQASIAVEDILPNRLSALDPDPTPAPIGPTPHLDTRMDRAQHHLVLPLLGCDTELAREFIRVDDPLATGIAIEAHGHAG